MERVLLILCLAVAGALTDSWRASVNSLMGRYPEWSRKQQTADCQRLVWEDTKLNNGEDVNGQNVHLCAEQSSPGGICYFSSVRKCCSKSALAIELNSAELTVGSKSVKVSALYAGIQDVCVFFDTSIDLCPTGAICIPVGCQEPVQTCANNSLGDCDPSGCKTCKEGYTAPSCCECEPNYQKAEDGSCKFVCSTNCILSNGQCTACSHPYSPPPFCCDCLAPFVKGKNGVCKCPDGFHEMNGTCERICSQNTVPCVNSPCCKTGFKSPLCCECIFDEIGDGDSYFQFGGQCKKICKANALKENCNVISGCSECEDSFKPSDCCECKEPKQLVDGVCRFCPLDQVMVDGKCKQFCDGHVVLGSCDGAKCQCLAGYIGNDCCQCAPAYVQDGNNCRRCPTGTVPDANQKKCICDQSQGTRILVNGKCIPVCGVNVLGACSESSCSCKSGFAAPDCCQCAPTYVQDGNNCRKCPPGTVPDVNQEKCICDQSQGRRILVDGKCIPVCGDNVLGACSESSCSCKSGFAAPDCCKCAPAYVKEGKNCRKCPPGTVPDANQEKCICDQSQGRQIFVDGKCIPICDYVMGECSETSCSCKSGFAPPDCCKCAGGSDPVGGKCPVPCIDNQNIFILMDRSSGIGTVELYDAMHMIEILTGALLRGTKNLTIDVLSYALSKDQTTPLMSMAPKVSSGTVTEERCISILADYEQNIANTLKNLPQNTLAGKTMELLEPLIQKGTHSTVITFSGTVSNYDETNNPVDRINSAIKTMKEKVGENNVKFFGASYIAENVIGVKTNDQVLREQQYKAEVLALAGGIPSQMAYIHDPVKLLQRVTEMLFNGGVLCQLQVDVIMKILSENAAANFESYDYCIHRSQLPCISKDEFNGCCKRKSSLDNKSTFLSAMRMLLDKLSN